MPRYRVGRLIRLHRKRARRSMLDLADEAEITPSKLQRWEAHAMLFERQLAELERIASALGLSLARLLADSREV